MNAAAKRSNVTRGTGLLEGLLARQRARMAERLIPPSHHTGRILDIGCGSAPYFLSRSQFASRVGVDKLVDASQSADLAANGDGTLKLLAFDIHAQNQLPLPDQSVDVVTCLAVFEHIRPDRLPQLLNEIVRVLRPGGIFIMTTPSGWTGPILATMTALRLVSHEEIGEHQDSYSQQKVRQIMAGTRMADLPKRFGYFELGMNLWAQVTRPVPPPSATSAWTPASTGADG